MQPFVFMASQLFLIPIKQIKVAHVMSRFEHMHTSVHVLLIIWINQNRFVCGE